MFQQTVPKAPWGWFQPPQLHFTHLLE